MADIEIEIDGQKLTAAPNETVIQVADAAGIYIPRFCYHKNLSIAANCRMCLVEVEKSPKALPACATPVMPGMKVFTKSQKAIEAQRVVMEFLLINHPLDCPICDQGGECELQDLAMGYGSSHSHYDECKRSIADENIGPLIATDMTRCIYCTRCVRFGSEIAGMREIGGTYRGENTEIGTYVAHSIESEVSGNIIDLCPVGALTSKPYRFTARAWEMQQYPSISPHDCLGTNINVHARYGKVMRVVARENNAINESWIADRDRFSYTGLYHADRLEEPAVKENGVWQAVDWQTALKTASEGLHNAVAEFGADKVGALASPSSTLEEFYLLQKVIRGLGSPHIDFRLREMDTADQHTIHPGLSMPIAELETCDAFILIGSNIRKEQPLAALRLRKAALKGAPVIAINPVDFDFNFPVTEKTIVAPHALPSALNDFVDGLKAKSSDKAVASLADKQKVCVIVGALAQHHEQASLIRAYAKQLADLTNGTLSILTDGANAAGGIVAGAISHCYPGGAHINSPGLNAVEMLEKPRKAYLLLNVEPDADCANAHQALEAMKQSHFIVAISLYRNPVIDAYADVILPMSAFTETSGTYINAAGDWQSFHGASNPFGSSRPAWKILRVLANFMHIEGFDYETSEQVRAEVKGLLDKSPVLTMQALHTIESTESKQSKPAIALEKGQLSRIGEIPIYAVDSLVRRSNALQEAQRIMEGESYCVRLHPNTARKLDLNANDIAEVKQKSDAIQLPVVIDERIAEDAVWIPGGIAAMNTLGNLMGAVTVNKL